MVDPGARGARRDHAPQAQHGSLAYQLGDVVGDTQVGGFGGFHSVYRLRERRKTVNHGAHGGL